MDAKDIRAAILAAGLPAPVSFPVPVLGDIHLRQLSGADMEAIAADREKSNRSGRSLARVICDSAGHLVFNVDDESDVEFLAALPWAVHSAITTRLNRDAGLTADGEVDAKKG